MLSIYYGEDRKAALEAARRALGGDSGGDSHGAAGGAGLDAGAAGSAGVAGLDAGAAGSAGGAETDFHETSGGAGTDSHGAPGNAGGAGGAELEVVEGENLTAADLPSIFLGASLLAAERRILVKDLLANADKDLLDKLPEYVKTPHKIILLEEKIDKRTAVYKALAKAAEVCEFKAATKVDTGLAFNVFDMALRNGPRAVEMAAELEKTSSFPEVIGAWTWKAAQNYQRHPGARERRVLQMLAEVDLQTKTSPLEPWVILRAFLLRVAGA